MAMFQVIFCVITIISMAATIGLISSLFIMSDEATHEQIYLLAGKIAVSLVLLVLVSGIIFLLIKRGGKK